MILLPVSLLPILRARHNGFEGIVKILVTFYGDLLIFMEDMPFSILSSPFVIVFPLSTRKGKESLFIPAVSSEL